MLGKIFDGVSSLFGGGGGGGGGGFGNMFGSVPSVPGLSESPGWVDDAYEFLGNYRHSMDKDVYKRRMKTLHRGLGEGITDPYQAISHLDLLQQTNPKLADVGETLYDKIFNWKMTPEQSRRAAQGSYISAFGRRGDPNALTADTEWLGLMNARSPAEAQRLLMQKHASTREYDRTHLNKYDRFWESQLGPQQWATGPSGSLEKTGRYSYKQPKYESQLIDYGEVA